MNANAKIDLDLSTLGNLNHEVRGFLLSCPKYPRYYQAAIDREHSRLPELLPDYLIVQGSR